MEAMQTIRKILTTSTFDVFEKMFFIFLEMSGEERQQYDLETSIRFSGPMEGEIRLYLSEPLAMAMAKNMLSMKPADVTREMMEDCAKEATNMIGGQFLRTLDTAKVFQLTLPVCVQAQSVSQRNSSVPDFEQWLNLESENGNLGIMVRLKEVTPA